jgi:hypothetical protein
MWRLIFGTHAILKELINKLFGRNCKFRLAFAYDAIDSVFILRSLLIPQCMSTGDLQREPFVNRLHGTNSATLSFAIGNSEINWI